MRKKAATGTIDGDVVIWDLSLIAGTSTVAWVECVLGLRPRCGLEVRVCYINDAHGLYGRCSRSFLFRSCFTEVLLKMNRLHSFNGHRVCSLALVYSHVVASKTRVPPCMLLIQSSLTG